MLRIVESSARSDTGRQRRTNEDAFYARAPVFAVADGMGGAQAGEIAASIAADSFEQRPDDAGVGEQMLRKIAETANKRIWELAHTDPDHSGMGTTLTAIAVGDNEVSVAHVGDSRAYRFRNGKLELLTRDHSLVEELKRQGTISEHEAEHHPQRSIITRALGPEPQVEVDTQTHSVNDGDTFLLCSDGLTTMVSDDEINEMFATCTSLDHVTSSLIAQANRAGGRDNITAVTFRIGSDDDIEQEDQHTIVGVRSPIAEHSEVGSVAIGAEESSKAQASVGGLVTADSDPAEPVSQDRSPIEKRRKRGKIRPVLALVSITIMLTGVVIAGIIGLQRVYFIGTDSHGLVTVYQGLPYELPVGVKLYREEYVSSMPAEKMRPFRRKRLLDHELRSRSDAVDLVRSSEDGR